MKIEDFILDDYYYETQANGVLVKIYKDAMNQNTVAYANKILDLYFYKKSKIIDYVLNRCVHDFDHDSHKKKEILEQLEEADIEIINNRWGCLTWNHHGLDEHTIQVEFNDEMQLSYVSIVG